MKKSLKLMTVLTMILAMVLSVCACGGSPKTLQEYLDKNEKAKTEFLSAMETDNDVLSIEGSVEGNKIIVKGTMKETFDETMISLMTPQFDAQVETIASEYDDIKGQLADQVKIPKEDIEIVLTYYNGDGSEIWTHTF